MKQNSTFSTFVIVGLYTFVFAEQASAYLDPGSGSMMLQLLFGGIAGVIVILKLYWNSFTNLFRRRRGQKQEAPSKERDL